MIFCYILFILFLETTCFFTKFHYKNNQKFYIRGLFDSKGSKYNIEGRKFDNPIDLLRYMEEIKRNITNNSPGYPKQSNQNIKIPGLDDNIDDDFENDFYDKVNIEDKLENELKKQLNQQRKLPSGVRIFIKRPESSEPSELGNMGFGPIGKINGNDEKTSSENFRLEDTRNNSFCDVGGYDNVKNELMQSADVLINYEKYGKYNIRPPKGLVLEGPPGNGKTLLTRSFSGEINSSFISVSGSQFQEKYVGVGSSRIRELFELAKNNKPCIIFIDEVDAIGRTRSGNGESSNAERDSTLNQLLVAMDGFSTSDGIFVICATNRVDLLDPALVRPGRIDKKIYIGNPDHKTREEIINIHIKGKPFLNCINETHLVDITRGFSGAQIENLLNEAMLYALRDNRTYMRMKDIETIMSRILVGYQSTESVFSNDMIDRIAIHELGHAIVGVFALDHSKLIKVCLNNWSPTSPGYTIFETNEEDSNIYTKEKLFSRLMVLLAGRIAEQVFFGASITTGASKDIEEAYKLAETMIIKYGMGKKMVNPFTSEKSKTIIDHEIEHLVDSAYHKSLDIINNNKKYIRKGATLLINKKTIEAYEVYNLIDN